MPNWYSTGSFYGKMFWEEVLAFGDGMRCVKADQSRSIENRKVLPTTQMPHREASRDSISRWIILPLSSKAGIKTSKFSGHSAAASAASCYAGLLVDNIVLSDFIFNK